MTEKTYNVLFLCTGNSARMAVKRAVDQIGHEAARQSPT